LAGFGAKWASRAHAYSAQDPLQLPNTSSPGWNRVTFAPTASTCPATSQPRTGALGLRRPNMVRMKYGRPVMKCQTLGSTPAACTRNSTSFALGTGLSTSASFRTSGEPY
jgi:hypothetical protein